MKSNPFSPSFAILPRSFSGRSAYLESYGDALDTPNSAYRFFFLTGTRGSGKTSLLHQYELLAEQRRWDVVKGASADVLDRLVHYAGLDKTSTRVRSLKPSVSAGGVDAASLGELSTAVAESPSLSLLGDVLVRKLGGFNLKKGLAILVDEAQKLKQEDAVVLGNVVQDVKSSGAPISLVLCGLPSAFERVRSLSDITFIRRMKREMLWPMTRREAAAFLRGAFGAVPEIGITDAQLEEIIEYTGGHPYLMQLVGDNVYRFFDDEFDVEAGTRVGVPEDIVERAKLHALKEYKDNVLDDVLHGVHKGTWGYIQAAFELRDEMGRADVGAINARFGKGAREMSSRRASALNTQVIRADGRGKVRFALPHYRYIFEDFEFEEPQAADDGWEY